MKPELEIRQASPRMVWIIPGRLDSMLDAATWLKTTRELRALGWDVTLVNAGPGGTHILNDVEVLSISSPDVYLFRQIIFHTKVLLFLLSNLTSIDLILFGQTSAPWILPIKLLRFLLRKKKPLLVMDTRTVPMEDTGKATLRDKLRGWFSNFMNYFGNNWVDGQTAITKRMADRLNIPANRLWGIWSSGADAAQFAHSFTARKWPAGDEPIHITYIGVLHYERNLMSLCEAVELANKDGLNFRLSLTGWGTEKDALERYAVNTQGRIQVNQAIPHAQVPDMLSKVHIGVLPFPDEEKYKVCSPIKLFEFMAAGLPILATRIVCFTDVIGDGAYAFWAEDATSAGLRQALDQIWFSRSKLESMGKASLEAAQFWTWKASARKLNDALEYGLKTHQVLTLKGN